MAKKRTSQPKRKTVARKSTAKSHSHSAYRSSSRLPDKRSSASALIEEAHASRDRERSYQLLLAAAELDPRNLDALFFLANFAPTLKIRIEHIERMVTVAREMLSHSPTTRGQAHEELEVDIFARMLLMLAEAYNEAMEWDKAIAYFREVLELSPDEELPTYQFLIPLLLHQQRFDEAIEILDRFPDSKSVCWLYSRLLIALQQGDSDENLSSLLEECRRANPHLAKFLTADEVFPREAADMLNPSEPDEAFFWYGSMLPAWQSVEGARQWLRRETASWPDLQPKLKAPKTGELATTVRKLKRLREHHWMVALFPAPPDNQQLWFLAIVDRDSNEVLHLNEYAHQPLPDAVAIDVLSFVVDEHDHRIAHRLTINHPELQRQLALILEPARVKVDFREFDVVELDLDLPGEISAPLDSEPGTQLPPFSSAQTWQLATVEMLESIYENGEYFRPFATMLIETEMGMVLAFELHRNRPTTDEQMGVVRKAVRDCNRNKYPPPSRIEFRSPDDLMDLQGPLSELGIKAVVGKDFTQLNEMLDHFFDKFSGGGTLPAVSNISGATTDDLQEFFVAAAEFYKARPWLRLPADVPFEVSIAEQKLTRLCTVMGQCGSTFGLSIFENLAGFRALIQEDSIESNQRHAASAKETRRKSHIWSVLYNEAHEISPLDLKAIEIQGWPVAGIQAFPATIEVRKSKACSVKSADLRANTICLQAFSQADREILVRKSKPQTVKLQSASNEILVTISPIPETTR